MQLIDAHHHLWDLQAVSYPWLEAKGVRRFFGDPTPIQNNYGAAELRRDAGSHELLGSVHVQVGCAPGQELEETRWLQTVAERDGLPSAIVASVDLCADDVEAQLDAHRAAAGALRGVRQIVGREPSDDVRTGCGAILAHPGFTTGLRSLSERELSFELQITVPQTPRFVSLLEQLQPLKIALCHMGSPWDQSSTGLRLWSDGLTALAQFPNVVCKLSGLSMFNPTWKQGEFVSLVSTALEIFGPDRCLYGSNFPVDGLHRRFDEIVAATLAAVAPLGAEAVEQVFVANARRFYGIKSNASACSDSAREG
jgi:predicted TIM-barrel fold metal-dependent hydrolase